MRQALEDKEDAKSLKQKTRERVRPKMGKLTIDYQKLHDAFFKWQTKPKMSIHGDLYYEVSARQEGEGQCKISHHKIFHLLLHRGRNLRQG